MGLLGPSHTGRARAAKVSIGQAGYDNSRENIDPHIKTKVVSTKEIECEGVAVRMTAGENLTKGNIVASSRSADNTALKAGLTDGTANRDMPIGIVLHNAAIGKSVLVIVSGKADVLNDGQHNVVCGDLAITSDTTSGTALVSTNPEVPATANHWREVGHAIESRTGAGLFKAIIHFN